MMRAASQLSFQFTHNELDAGERTLLCRPVNFFCMKKIKNNFFVNLALCMEAMVAKKVGARLSKIRLTLSLYGPLRTSLPVPPIFALSMYPVALKCPSDTAHTTDKTLQLLLPSLNSPFQSLPCKHISSRNGKFVKQGFKIK